MAKSDSTTVKAAAKAPGATAKPADAAPAKAGVSLAYPDFDLENPEFPQAIKDKALTSGGFAYDEKIKSKVYDEDLLALQLECLKMQAHVEASGQRVVALFEGRDASGKGGCIGRILERVNPRHARSVALTPGRPLRTTRASSS